ncbi:hypothetical protein EDC56_2885 [Sinobacterium caligoides]|uniref:TIGR01777 family protein n=1 Tax=Sinobacterium caligoides TaxID=933926 RepID=A0A3N2DKD1_9GAMM|nr:TIGR01777 family oxidoreductase [Sinobacterium caligoides]ROS00247.1 hypothetical protein EDC56_2885 [Sinobacterium caligoides]
MLQVEALSVSCFERYRGDRKNILLSGGTGFIGSRLVPVLVALGHRVTVLTRSAKRVQGEAASSLCYVTDLSSLGDDFAVDVVINLAGESLAAHRWNKQRKAQFIASRLQVTEQLQQLVQRLQKKPEVWINASAIGFYGPHGDEVLTEEGAVVEGYSHGLCAVWERAAQRIEEEGVRVCILRIGMVLGEGGGPLQELKQPFTKGVAAQIGDGKQWVSWVHRDDIVSMLLFLMTKPACHGCFNGTAPLPVTNAQLTELMAEHYRILLRCRMPGWLLKLAVGELAEEVLLTGQRVVPQKLEAAGFLFLYRDLGSALTALLTQPAE